MDLSRAHQTTLVLLSFLAFTGAGKAPSISLRFEANAVNELAGSGTVAAVGLEPLMLEALNRRPPDTVDWKEFFPIRTSESRNSVDLPVVAGKWVVEDGIVHFHPRYPFVRGITYVASLDLDKLRTQALGIEPQTAAAAPIEMQFSLEKRETTPTTVVSSVYPSASVLPANLLKFYLHFSAPMSRGRADQHIRLLDDTGRESNGVFLEVGEELWDTSQQRLTLFFDPGRIKRGLRPHLEAGPPLVIGSTYRLVIDSAWHDATGLPLARGFEKVFTAALPDRQALDPDEWQLDTPPAGSTEPLSVHFGEPLDHGLLQRVIHILDPDGSQLEGRSIIDDEEHRWFLTPESPWSPGTYALVIDRVLEDLAGNNLNQVFDLEISAPKAVRDTLDPSISIPFAIMPANPPS